jgi:hypothetical protein
MEIHYCDLSERSISELDERTARNHITTPVRMAG